MSTGADHSVTMGGAASLTLPPPPLVPIEEDQEVEKEETNKVETKRYLSFHTYHKYVPLNTPFV